MSTQRHPRRSDEEWLALIQECRTSGLSDKVWCNEHHIQPSNFYYHIRRLRAKSYEIPDALFLAGSSMQEVVPITFDDSIPFSSQTIETAVRIQIHGLQIEITNSACSDTIYHTLSALQKLC